MNASITPTKKQLERVRQYSYQENIDCMSDNLATTLLVLADVFGFGEKRLRQFLRGTAKWTEKFRSYGDMELARDEFLKILSGYGIEKEDIYFDTNLIIDMQARKVERRNAVSVKEAQTIQKQLQMMKQIQQDQNSKSLKY